jgi:hypothetical protein
METHMRTILITAIAIHVLAGVFWAGSTFALARSGGIGGEQLFRPQMGAALIAVLAGIYLWHLQHEGPMSITEHVLATGATAAIIAAGVQGMGVGPAVRGLLNGTMPEEPARRRIATAERIAAGLLAITVACMAVARYA